MGATRPAKLRMTWLGPRRLNRAILSEKVTAARYALGTRGASAYVEPQRRCRGAGGAGKGDPGGPTARSPQQDGQPHLQEREQVAAPQGRCSLAAAWVSSAPGWHLEASCRRRRRVPACARGRSRLRPMADPVAAGRGYDGRMASIATRLRLPVQVQDIVLAVSVALFQLLGTSRAVENQPE